MIWLSPMSGLVLGAIVIPLLLLLYFLRLRRQTVQISSTMLWERAVEDLHANTPFQKLRPSSLLLLQLIALGLVVVAIMQPQMQGAVENDGKHVLLIDNSGSMMVEEEGFTRLDLAKEKAMQLVEQMYGGGLFSSTGSETMVIAFSDTATLVLPFTDSKQQILHAIQSIQPTHGRSLIGESLQLARAYTSNVNPESAGISEEEAAQYDVFSDGLIDDLATQAMQRGESFHYHKIGAISGNVGIATINAKRPTESSNEVQVFLSLLNTHNVPKIVDVELRLDGIPIGVQQVKIPSQLEVPGNASVVFSPFELPSSGLIQAMVLQDDSLGMDNIASFVIQPAKQLKVLLAEQGAPILQTILEGMSLAELKVVDALALESLIRSGDTSNFDVVVARDMNMKELPFGSFLLFGPPPPIKAFESFVEGEPQVMLVSDEEHQAMRFVRYEDVIVTTGYDIVLSDTVRVLLEGSHWPAIMSYRSNESHIIYAAFDPLESNWPYLRSFPFFVFNSVQFLGHSGNRFVNSVVQIGETISHIAPKNKDAVLTEPDGQGHAIRVDESGMVFWGPIRLSGIHTIAFEGRDIQMAVNTLQKESIIAPQDSISVGAKLITSISAGGSSFIQLWPFALGAVLVVLLAEWWVYQRKTSAPSLKMWTAKSQRGGVV